MESLTIWLKQINSWVWGPLTLALLVGTGIYLTILLKGIQFRRLGYALKLALLPGNQKGEGDISHFQALMTALAATIGIGNIAGVATAVMIGGVGAVFWMWVTALVGMATKYAEAILAVKYRVVDEGGQMCGGPMYYIKSGFKSKWLAFAFALFGTIAAIGTGNMVQSHSVADALYSFTGVNPWWIGLFLSILTGVVLLGGIKSIGRVTGVLVPCMALFYIAGGLFILASSYQFIPEAVVLIVKSAFTGQAAVGGFAGSTLLMALQMGVARGVFSNEAGLGSASIAAAAAKTDSPGRQALVSMTGTFLDTIIVCSITGLVIAITEVVGTSGVDGSILNGVPLTIAAFSKIIPFGGVIVTVGAILFAYSTIIGWAYYGEKCCEYLLGYRSIIPYRVCFTLFVAAGAGLSLELVWTIADISNGLMAIPNLIALLALTKIVVKESNQFELILAEEKRQKKRLKASLSLDG